MVGNIQMLACKVERKCCEFEVFYFRQFKFGYHIKISKECDNIPSYLKLTPYPNFKTLLFSFGIVSMAKSLHTQFEIKVIKINGIKFILPC